MSRGAGRRLGGVAAAALGCLALWSPAASAAAPANDHFANRSILGPGLPVEVSTTNAEATREVGEPLHGPLGSSGHSIWFEWEATGTGLVTIGTCGSDFATALGVYTGTAVGALTQIASSAYGDGPNCPDRGSEATFVAQEDVTYVIAVDGDPFYVPPAAPPLGEGLIALQIDATPSPSNDDFIDATTLVGSTYDKPGEETLFYSAFANGFNWNAGKEAGEPDHAGDPGGASVWYAWTAPGSGAAGASACAGKPVVTGVYVGNSLGTLASVGSNDFPCLVTFDATAGTTYRIAVDGRFDVGAGGPAMSNFPIWVLMELPRPPSTDMPGDLLPMPDLIAPETTISKFVLRRMPPIWIFRFHSSEPGSTFRCKLDKRRFANCGPSRAFRHLKPGRHTLRVIAVDAAGNADPTPAVARFSMPRRSRGEPVLMSRSEGFGD